LLGRTSKITALLLCLLLFGLVAGIGMAGAAVEDDIVDEISKIYPHLSDQDKQYITQAKNEVGQIGDDEWPGILQPILTGEIIGKLGGNDQAVAGLSQILIDLANIQYADPDSEPGVLKGNIRHFINNNSSTVSALIGTNFDAEDLLLFSFDIKDEVISIVEENPIYYASVLLNNDQDAIAQLIENALSNALNQDAWSELKAQLTQLGLGDVSTAAGKFISVRNNFHNYVDRNHNAEKALIKGFLAAEIKEDGGGGGGGGGAAPSKDVSDEIDEAADIVTNPDATDEEVAEAVEKAADAVKDLAAKLQQGIGGEDAAEQVAEAAAGLSAVLEKAAARVQDAAAAGKLGDAAAKVMDALAQAAGYLAGEGKQKAGESAAKTLVAAARAVGGMDADKAADIADKLIRSAGQVAGAVQGEAARNVAENAVKLAERVIARAGTDTIDANAVETEDGKPVVQVDPERLQKKARQAVQAAGALADKLQESGLVPGKKLETRVVVEVPATSQARVETRLPAGTLDELAGSGVDRVEIKTEVASFGITPGAFGGAAAGEEVALSAARVDREEISAAARSQVPENSIVVDLKASAGGEKVSTFAEAIEVSIPYILAEGENPNEVTVFLLKEDGTVEPVADSVYDTVTGRVKFFTDHFSKYFAKTARVTFGDLAGWNWAKDDVELLAGRGVITGRSENVFDPGADITRAEFSALVVRMLALQAPADQPLPFADVPAGAWYRQEVAAAYANGIVRGKAESVFDPQGKITRQEMAVIIARVLEARGYLAGDESDLAGFADRGLIAGWARAGAALAAREGIVKGMGDGSFAPTAQTNRAQAAVMLYRLLHKLY